MQLMTKGTVTNPTLKAVEDFNVFLNTETRYKRSTSYSRVIYRADKKGRLVKCTHN